MQSERHFLSHPIIGNPSMDRVLAMSIAELRLLDNAKKALADCDVHLPSGRVKDHCIEALLKGLDAARKLRQQLGGTDAADTTRGNKSQFIALLQTSIPAETEGGPTFSILDTESNLIKTFSIVELIYKVRCFLFHENECLDEAETTAHSIQIRWDDYSENFVLKYENAVVVINGLLLTRRLREILSHFVTSLEGMITFAKTGKATISINPPIGHIQPEARKQRP